MHRSNEYKFYYELAGRNNLTALREREVRVDNTQYGTGMAEITEITEMTEETAA